MDLTTLQQERNPWVARNFGNTDTLESSIFGAMEEIGELAHHYLKRSQNIRGGQNSEASRAEMLDAVGDCVVFLAGVCTHLEADFGVVVQAVWDEVKTRDWVNYPTDGRTH